MKKFFLKFRQWFRCAIDELMIFIILQAFPCISTGIYGYPNLPAAHVAIGTARKFLEDADTASQVSCLCPMVLWKHAIFNSTQSKVLCSKLEVKFNRNSRMQRSVMIWMYILKFSHEGNFRLEMLLYLTFLFRIADWSNYFLLVPTGRCRYLWRIVSVLLPSGRYSWYKTRWNRGKTRYNSRMRSIDTLIQYSLPMYLSKIKKIICIIFYTVCETKLT